MGCTGYGARWNDPKGAVGDNRAPRNGRQRDQARHAKGRNARQARPDGAAAREHATGTHQRATKDIATGLRGALETDDGKPAPNQGRQERTGQNATDQTRAELGRD